MRQCRADNDALEAQKGSPSGRLYADSACEFLAHHVIRTYSRWMAIRHALAVGSQGVA